MDVSIRDARRLARGRRVRTSVPGQRGCRAPAGRALRHGGLVLLLLLLAFAPSRASEPLLTVSKNMLLGGATGLVLGGTLTLVVDEEDRSEVVRWSAVLGTFGGFALGVVLALRGDEDLFGSLETERQPSAAAGGQVASVAWSGATALSRRAPPSRSPPRERMRPTGAGSGGWGLHLTLLRLDW
ncbi:MAG: hypothetical protein GF330_05935 [Candidatus Eisenbacteria bacterium]|nr:hypothetical protein [Candidatus Eisenbacteria bacterium]